MLLKLYNNCLGSTGRLGPCGLDRLVTRQGNAHAALAIYFWLAEQSQRSIRLAQRGAQIGESGLGRLAFHQNHRRSRWAELTDQRNRQTKNRPRMQGELRQVLGNQSYQTGVVRARRD